MAIRNVGSGVANAARKVRDYTRARPTTAGDLPTSSSASAAIAGAIEGYISGGPIIAGAGVLGGYVGVKAGEKSGSFAVALGTGAVVGGGVGVISTLSLAALMNAPVAGPALGFGAMLGAFSGAVGTLSGSRRATTRDGVYGGLMSGALARVFVGNPALVVAGAVGGGIGGKAPTPVGRFILGGMAGAASGALSAVLGGPALMIPSAVAGAAVGAIGAVMGPVVRQVQRNATEDLTRKLIEKIDPYVQKHGISRGQKIALGAAAGALTLGPLGLLFGLRGLGIAAGIGMTVGGISTWNFLHRRDPAKQAPPAPPPEPPPADAPALEWAPADPQLDTRGMTPPEIAVAWAEGRLGGPRVRVAPVPRSAVPPQGGAPPQPAIAAEPTDAGLERPAAMGGVA